MQLETDGQRELEEMMRLYERGLLRKSQALKVAVQRGLHEPLQAGQAAAESSPPCQDSRCRHSGVQTMKWTITDQVGRWASGRGKAVSGVARHQH